MTIGYQERPVNVSRFWVWAEGYYVKSDDTPTQELDVTGRLKPVLPHFP